MGVLDHAVVASELCGFLGSSVLADGVEITPDTALAEIGVDSFSLMEVLLFVEERFGVELSMASLTPENTHSVAAITRCVVEQRA